MSERDRTTTVLEQARTHLLLLAQAYIELAPDDEANAACVLIDTRHGTVRAYRQLKYRAADGSLVN